MEQKTRIETIVELAILLKRSPGIVVDIASNARFVAEAKTMEHIRRIAALTAKVVAKYGVVKLEDVRIRATELLKRSLPTSAIDSVIRSCAGFRWVDQTAGYFWLNNGQPNMLRRRIRRVLSVAPRISVGELRAAIRRDHRYEGQVPPVQLLLEWCGQLSECRVDGNDVVAADPDYPLDNLRGDEATIVALLLEHGPVCQREKLQKLAVAAGIGRPSFWRCLTFCPTITRYARGVFGLTGAKVLPGEIKSLIPPIPKNEVLQDHGWTDDGKVWIAYRLSENTVDTGALGVPAAKREYIQGEFALRTTAENAAGTLVVKGSSAWGLGGYLSKSGAESGDVLVLEISSKEKSAVVRLGDDTLLDEMLSDYCSRTQTEVDRTGQ